MNICLLAEHPQYCPEIAQWYFDEWACLSPHASIERVIADVIAKSHSKSLLPLSYIALSDTTLAAVAELKYREHKGYPDYEHWLGGVFVSPNYRRQGVAKALITKALHHADGLGIRYLYLQTEDKNRILYQQFGFHPLHETEPGIFIMMRDSFEI